MTRKETLTTIENELAVFGLCLEQRREGSEDVDILLTSGATILIYPSDLVIGMGNEYPSSDNLCAVTLSKLSEIAVGKHKDGWYLHIYLNGKNNDFFNIRIA